MVLPQDLTGPPACQANDDPGAGISLALAAERSSIITSLRYELTFAIPAALSEAIRGRAVIRFAMNAPHRVVIDFAQPRDRVVSITSARRLVAFTVSDNHVIVSAADTAAGDNELDIQFIAGDQSLNRNEEFLYSLLVPARAHLAFPCFDQPDLKARFALTLEVPSGWAVVANGADVERRVQDGRATVRFAETQPLPTYLFAFAAGKFTVESAERNDRTFRMFHRETDTAMIARNREALFDLHAGALAWLEEYTGIPYPFGKFDFVLIPSFQFGGMEHAGAILYHASSLMLEPTATQNQFLERASLIAHETAHMWFGDLVTMRWFDDVWMKEVCANFMAGKIVNPAFPGVNHDLRFLLSNYPAAYEVDRTAGSNPIRQPLANLKDAGTLYGAVIYQKAPVVMRQLEMIVGPEKFRDGLREYLTRYAFGNATWPDLIRVLGERTTEDLSSWSRVWVESRGRPRLSVARHVDADGRLSRLEIVQQDPMGRGLLWPQRVVVSIGGDAATMEIPVFLRGPVTPVPGVAGLGGGVFVLINGGGLAYGEIELDPVSQRQLLERVAEIPDVVTRGAAWVTLWDNLIDGRVAPAAFLDAAARALPQEADEQNTDRVLAYVTRAFWKFLPERERLARAPALELMLRGGLDRADTPSRKATWFSALRDVTLSADGVAWLERVWRQDARVPGLTLAETDETTLAMELAVRGAPGSQTILERQLARIQNQDRRARFEFVMPSLSPDPLVREQSFERFMRVENRHREPWVLDAQRYLNHPLRESHARRFVGPSLRLLEEIQRTGDIFFPKRWMDATLGGHRDAESMAVVEDFLARSPQLPERLRWVVLTAADELSRAARR